MPDYDSHLAKMQQGLNGSWLYGLLFTAEPHQPILLQTFYVGLGHVARGIEAWAADLAAALHDRNEDVVLYKGGGVAALPYERVIPCWQRDRSPVKARVRWCNAKT